MLSALLLFGCFVVFIDPGSCCGEQEYGTSDGQCCPKCFEGAFVLRDCTPLRSTGCRHCANGTFMNRPNALNKCFPCTSCVSANGLFVKQACTARTDTVCDVLSGYICRNGSDTTGCSLAEKHSRCAPGQQIKKSGTREMDTVCEDCQDGYFSEDGVKCLAWRKCSELNVVKSGDSRNNVVCRKSLINHGSSYHDLLYPPLVIFVLQLFMYFL